MEGRCWPHKTPLRPSHHRSILRASSTLLPGTRSEVSDELRRQQYSVLRKVLSHAPPLVNASDAPDSLLLVMGIIGLSNYRSRLPITVHQYGGDSGPSRFRESDRRWICPAASDLS